MVQLLKKQSMPPGMAAGTGELTGFSLLVTGEMAAEGLPTLRLLLVRVLCFLMGRESGASPASPVSASGVSEGVLRLRFGPILRMLCSGVT